MSVLDNIKFRMCAFKIPLLSGSTLPRISGRNFPDLILNELDGMTLSVPVNIFISYITKASTPDALLRRFNDSEFFIRYIGSRALTATQKDYANELLTIIARQREVLILSFIRFWSQTGNVRALKGLLRHLNELSYSLQAYLKHELVAWEIYMYCSVRFQNSNRTYYYISDDETLCIGDTVLVPTGEDNILTPAEIVKITRHTYETVPLPLSMTKKIHSRVE